MHKEIPTAKVYIENAIKEMIAGTSTYSTESLMKEFAKLHVKAALEAADKLAENEFNEKAWDLVDNKNFILNAYDLNLIK